MKYNLLFIVLLAITISFSYSYGALPPPDTSFVITIVDESNKKIELPAFVVVREILDGELIQSYRINFLDNPQTYPIDWTVPTREANTEIHITAIKQGFEQSDDFVFTITDQTPNKGILFENTFTLSQDDASIITKTSHSAEGYGKSFDIATTSTSEIQSVNILQEENAVLIILKADELVGYININIPTSLMKTYSGIWIDDEIVAIPKVLSANDINLDYSNGLHSILIASNDARPGAIVEVTSTEEVFKEEDKQIPDTSYNQDDSGGGCLIATVTYGSELSPQVQQLRELRDNKLLQTESGTLFMNSFNEFYYSFSPYIADYERESPLFKEIVKITLTPLISSLSILNYVDMDSDSKVLGYGISLIILNLGMYIGIPIFAIIGIKKTYTHHF